MSYIGFGIQNASAMRKPKNKFRPVFEQLSKGEHPIKSNNTNPSVSWKEIRHKLDEEERQGHALSNKVYATILFISMLAMIIAQIG